jgi:HD superfamily phosphohydrolase
MERVSRVITGQERLNLPGAGQIPDILAEHGLDPQVVADLICKRHEQHPYLQQMIFGEVDADTLDYLRRDFANTGVAFGHIDIERVLNTMVIHNGRLAFRLKGIQAVRDFLNARVEMYSAVYLHRKTRIVDQMLLRAAERAVVELGEFPDFCTMTDDEFLSALASKSADAYVREIACRLKFRRDLFKLAFNMESSFMSKEEASRLRRIGGLAETAMEVRDLLEKRISLRAGLDSGYVLVDLPLEAARQSESRFWELDIRFVDDDGQERSFAETDTAFAEYIGRAKPTRSSFSVYCSSEHRERVAEATVEVLRELDPQLTLPMEGIEEEQRS